MLVVDWHEALHSMDSFLRGSTAPPHLDALQCLVKRDPEGHTVGQINIRPDHDGGSSSSSGSRPESHSGSDSDDDDDVSQA